MSLVELVVSVEMVLDVADVPGIIVLEDEVLLLETLLLRSCSGGKA